jgi:hypothetical protein
LWHLVRELPRRLPALQAVIFEIFPTFLQDLGSAVVVDELHRMRAWLAEQAIGTAPSPVIEQAPVLTFRSVDSVTPLAALGGPWEAALTSLVTGQSVQPDDADTDAMQASLTEEAGVPLVRDLVFSFRASMVVQVLRLTTRLLLCSVGPEVFRRMLRDTFEHHPPALYATLEANAFAAQVAAREWNVPYLAEMLGYELALTQTLIDGQARIVKFSFEPIPLLRALTDGRLPDEVPELGRFEIELLPDADNVLC